MPKDGGVVVDGTASKTEPGCRASRSASAARAAEIARLRRMTPLEAMALALALGRRRRELAARPPLLARHAPAGRLPSARSAPVVAGAQATPPTIPQ